MTTTVDPAEFAGQRVLVTGGSKGLGRATVDRFVAGGARVITAARGTLEPIDGVEFVQADLWGDLEADAIVSNPPYVESGARLMPDVAQFEPHGALFAGADGLDVIRRLAAAPVGWIALEHGHEQADAVEAILLAAGFGEVRRVRDYAGIERVAVAR